MSQKNLLILDLDETLIRAEREVLDRAHDFAVGPYFIMKRPHLDRFVDFCASLFRIGVWSSASDDYVQAVCRQILQEREDPLFVWAASKVTYVRTLPQHHERYGYDLGFYHNQKRLKKVSKSFGWPIERILIVDDSPEKSAQNYGNVVHPKPFLGEPDDDELPLLASYLEQLSKKSDFRSLEKRNWRAGLNPKW